MKNRQFILLFLSVVNVMIGYGLVIPFVSVYQNYFGVTILMTGLLISFYALGQFLFAPISGDLVARFGERKVIVVAQILFGIFTILVFTIHIFVIMIFFRFLTGMCAACIYSSSEHYVATKASQVSKTRALMLLSVASGVGMIIGPLIGVYILEFMALTKELNDSQILDITSILAIVFVLYVFVIAALVFFNFPKEFDKTKALPNVKVLNFFPSLFRQIYYTCRTPQMLFILSGFFLYGYITSSIEAYFLDFVMKTYDINRLILGIEGIILITIGVFFFFKVAPYLESKFRTISLLILYLLVPSLAFFVLVFIPPLGLFFPMFVLIMATTAIFSSLLIDFISKETSTPSIVLGFKNSVISMGMILGPIISGYFYGISNHNFMLQICIALIIVAIFGIFIRQKYYKRG